MTKDVFFAVVLKVLEALVAAKNGPETVYLPDLAHAVTEASGGSQGKAIALMNQADHESNLSARIQLGECSKYECDPLLKRGVVVLHKARGIWQVQDDKRGRLWEQSLGLNREALIAGATLAAQRLNAPCKTLEERYSAQGGKGCHTLPWGVARAKRHREIEQIWNRMEWIVKHPPAAN